MAFDTATEYKSWSGSTVADATVTESIGIAQRMIENFLGFDKDGLETASRTELYDGTGHDTLRLQHWPVTSITSVKSRTDKTTFDTIDASTYDVTTRGDLYFVDSHPAWDGTSGVFGRGRKNWQIVYTAGYTVSGGSEDRPDDLLKTLRGMVSDILRLRDSDHDGSLVSESMGAYTYSLDAEQANAVLTKERKAVLAAGYLRGSA